MQREYKVRDNQTYYDLALLLYNDIEQVTRILSDNNLSLSDDPQGLIIVWDTDFRKQNPIKVELAQPDPTELEFVSRDFQTIWDLAIMFDGNLESIVNLMQKNSIDGVNSRIEPNTVIKYERKKNFLTNLIASKGRVIVTASIDDGSAFTRGFKQIAFN